MSVEKSPFQVQREKLAGVIADWQAAESDDDGPFAHADALVDHLADAGLQILPLAPDGIRFVVEVDGKAAVLPGTSSHTGPLNVNEAVETVIAEASAAYEADEERVIVMRPATESEGVASLRAGVTGEQP